MILVALVVKAAHAEKCTSAESYFERGCVRSNQAQIKGAIDDYNQAIKLNPKFANAYLHRGYVWQSLGNSEDAINDFKIAVELDPKLTEAASGVSMMKKPEAPKQNWIAELKNNWNKEIKSADIKKIEKGMSTEEVFALLGPPEKDIGSGIHIFVYTLADGSSVNIGCVDKVLYVHGSAD